MAEDPEILKKLATNFERIEAESGKTIIRESKRIGVGKGVRRNLRSGLHISSTAEEAKSYEMYENIMLGQPVLEEALDDDMIDRVLDHLINEIFDKDIIG